MRGWTVRLTLAAVLLVSTALGACRSAKQRPAGDDGGAPASPVAQADQVLARVGDRVITVAEFAAALDHMDQFDRMRYEAPERRQELLGEMIDVMLLADEARSKGYDKDPLTQQELREILRDAMLAKAREGVPAPSDVPETETRAYYDHHPAEFRDPERRRVSAIVLPTEGAATHVLPEALAASPLQWGDLVRTKSTDPHARDDVPADLAGDLGFVGPPGDPRGANDRVPNEVRAAVFEAARVGDVVPRVVHAANGYYIVKLAARSEAHARSFDEARRAIQIRIVTDEIRAKEKALVDSLRREYPVSIDEAALDQVKVDLPAPEVDGGR